MQWFRLYNEWAHDPKIQMLDMASQRHFIMLCCMHSEGYLRKDTTTEEIAWYLRISVDDAIVLTEKMEPFRSKGTWCLQHYSKARRPIPDEVRNMVFFRDGFRCAECDGWMYLEVDHVVPLSRGGSDEVNNLTTLCRKCNRSKANKLLHEWREGRANA